MELYIGNLNITAKLTHGTRKIVKDLTFSALSGAPLAIVGESGSGKTMTALSVFGLLPENCRAAGNAVLDGVDLLSLSEKQINVLRGREIIYIPQSGADFLNPALKIKTQITESLNKNGVRDKTVAHFVAREKLRAVGLDEADEVLNKYPYELSGGQAQRVVLAISLCASPKLVIADEPTKGIDAQTASLFVDNLTRLFSDAVIIVITHDISVAGRCKKLLLLHEGCVAEYGEAAEILKNPQAEYTKSLLKALPENMRCDNAVEG